MYSSPHRFSFLVIMLLLLISCDKYTVFDQVISIPIEGWDYTNKIEFEYVISDTLSSYDIQLYVRNTKNYAYSNLWLFIETMAPSGNYRHDTIEVTLADETGRWAGKSTQSINTLMVPYQQNIRFADRGIYKTLTQHAMRDTLLQDITDIGLHIQYHISK